MRRATLGLMVLLTPVTVAGQDPTNGWLTAGTTHSSSFFEFEELESWDEWDNLRCDEFGYRGTRGEQVRVTLRSSAFDPWLLVGYRRAEGSIDGIDNDDMPGSLNSQVEFHIDETPGTLWIVACALNAGTGAFTLDIERLSGGGAPAPAPAPDPAGLARVTGSPPAPETPTNGWIDRNQDHNSFLGESEGLETWGSQVKLRCDNLGYQARPGELTDVRLASADFDAWLLVGYRNADGSISGVINDDHEGLDARVQFRADQTGRPLRIYACARTDLGIRSGAGTYRLSAGPAW